MIDAKTADVSNLATRMVKFLSPRSSGRGQAAPAPSRSVAPPTTTSSSPTCWPHVSTRRWCQTPLGTEIRDRSVNGTFVNGTRVGSAILTEDDVVTIGNVDLVFRDGTLIKRSEAATRTGGLEVRESSTSSTTASSCSTTSR